MLRRELRRISNLNTKREQTNKLRNKASSPVESSQMSLQRQISTRSTASFIPGEQERLNFTRLRNLDQTALQHEMGTHESEQTTEGDSSDKPLLKRYLNMKRTSRLVPTPEEEDTFAPRASDELERQDSAVDIHEAPQTPSTISWSMSDAQEIPDELFLPAFRSVFLEQSTEHNGEGSNIGLRRSHSTQIPGLEANLQVLTSFTSTSGLRQSQDPNAANIGRQRSISSINEVDPNRYISMSSIGYGITDTMTALSLIDDEDLRRRDIALENHMKKILGVLPPAPVYHNVGAWREVVVEGGGMGGAVALTAEAGTEREARGLRRRLRRESERFLRRLRRLLRLAISRGR